MKEENFNSNTIINNIFLNLEKAAVDRKHDYHNCIFSNLDLNNQPTSRTVVLRSFNQKDNLLTFHTDYRSIKIKEIEKNNNCVILFYSETLKQQLRIKVLASIQNNNLITKKAWEKTQLMSRKCYLSSLSPGTEIKDSWDGLSNKLIGKEPTKNESEIGYKNFSVIVNKIISIDWLYLSSSGHKRLLFNWKNGKRTDKWMIP